MKIRVLPATNLVWIHLRLDVGSQKSANEKMIRKVIENSVNRFNGVNRSAEDIRLSYLEKYPVKYINFGDGSRSVAIRKIKVAIECIIPRTSLRQDLKTYDQYLQSEILNDGEDKNFETWLTYIQDKRILTK